MRWQVRDVVTRNGSETRVVALQYQRLNSYFGVCNKTKKKSPIDYMRDHERDIGHLSYGATV